MSMFLVGNVFVGVENILSVDDLKRFSENDRIWLMVWYVRWGCVQAGAGVYI